MSTKSQQSGGNLSMRTTLFVAFRATLVAAIFSTSLQAADSNAGKLVFRQQCALCHSAEPSDNGGAQGPELHGVFGRAAASNPAFTYTQPLRASRLVWDAATLERFLASPTTVVPGSSMVFPVAKAQDRQDLIAYFSELKAGTFQERPQPGRPAAPPAAANPAAPTGEGEWRKDAPGRVHRIDVTSLPAPYATPGVRNFPRVVDQPAGAKLAVPEGFSVAVFAKGLQGPRTMRRAPNGDIFVAEQQAGRIRILVPSVDGATAASTQVYAQGLVQPFGLQFYPLEDPKWLYVGENNRVVRYAYKRGDRKAGGIPEVIVPQLYPGRVAGHSTRDIAFSMDGRRLFVSVGSLSNFAEDMPKKTVTEAQAWERIHGLGATWADEANRALVLVFDLQDGKAGPGRTFATGIRNCVGLTVQPATGDLWCTTNERDMLGDNLVPDYTTRVKQGGFYGWPWYYLGNHEEPRLKGDRPDLAGKAIVPDVLFQAHSAALTLNFYTQTTGASAFPRQYLGDGFAVLHGSWNRTFRTGHKVVRVRMKDGVPTGDYEDFLTGFIADDGNAWGRPVGTVVAQDGSMLLSEDGNNTIYRIAFRAARAAPP
ncbi:MAG: PQQ-dependent sugar dehydrogenase [Steroidobacteraceae bacterium]